MRQYMSNISARFEEVDILFNADWDYGNQVESSMNPRVINQQRQQIPVQNISPGSTEFFAGSQNEM